VGFEIDLKGPMVCFIFCQKWQTIGNYDSKWCYFKPKMNRNIGFQENRPFSV
jgi:hypothetical protein